MRDGYQRTLVTARLSAENFNISKTDKAKQKAIAALGLNGDIDVPDLAFATFVLVSEHENYNADYFKRDELVNAYKTPRHKPVNVEHTLKETASYISAPLFNDTKNTIIGHMVDTAIATKDGRTLTPEEVASLDMSDDPSRPNEECIDIVASAVLYDFYFPQTIADVQDTANKGEMCVSMECWFKGNDYIVGNEFVEATTDNAYLKDDWHNRKVVGGRRVCRALSGVLFGGVAVTKNPANEESVFLTASAQDDLARLSKRHDEIHILYKFKPTEELEQEHIAVTKAAAAIMAKFEEKGS